MHEAVSAKTESAPEFLGDKWRVGMEELEDAFDGVIQRGQCPSAARGVSGEIRLRDFDEAVAEIPPDEVIERLGDIAETVGFVAFVYALGRCIESGQKIAGEEGEFVFRGIRIRIQLSLHLTEPAGIPQLVAEISSLDDLLFVELDVLSLRSDAQESKADAIRAVFRDEVKRIRRIAEALGHFAALLVADDACEIHILEGNLPSVFQTRHDHAGDPEKDDVRAGNQHAGREEFRQRGGFHRLMRPQPRGEPGVEHIGVLHPALAGRLDLAFCIFRIDLTRRIPDRDAVAPPELAGDAPVLDVFEPVVVNFFPAVGKEADEVLPHGVAGFDSFRIS